MKNLFCSFLLISLSFTLRAQQIIDLEEKQPYENNGLEYGFYITNESSKEVKGEDFDRFEISLYVTNKSGCIKLIPFSNTSNNNSSEEVVIAEFSCKNATGKRLTAKAGKVNARPLYSQAKVQDQLQPSKYKFVNAQVGYAIKNGQTFTTKIIVIVPKGERPKITCRIIYLPELN
jgi:hypothetical protein